MAVHPLRFCVTLKPLNVKACMFKLSAHHCEEIAAIPELLVLVEGTTVHGRNMEPFVKLCVEHMCVQTFLAVAPGPLTVLAKYNAVALAQRLDGDFHPEAWKRAARRAAKEGHMEFAQYVLTHHNTEEIRKSLVTGACMGDQWDVVKRFAPLVKDATFAHHIPPLVAQHSAVDCMKNLVSTMSSRVWLSTMAVAVLNDHSRILDILMDHVPTHTSPTSDWCLKVGQRAVNRNHAHRVLHFVLQNISATDLLQAHPNMPDEKKQQVISIHQHILLTTATCNVSNTLSKRKM